MGTEPRFGIANVDPEFLQNFDPDQPRDEKGRWVGVPQASAIQSSDAGSANYEIRRSQGWIEGPARYASEEPHHSRSEYGAWNYVQMHNEKRERILSLIIDGQYDGTRLKGKGSAKATIVERFPVVSESPEADYSEETAKTFLVRDVGGISQHIRIHPSSNPKTGFVFYSDGWDEIERDGDEWVATYYQGVLEREE